MELIKFIQTFSTILIVDFESSSFSFGEQCSASRTYRIIVIVLVTITFELKFLSDDRFRLNKVDRTLILTVFTCFEAVWPVFALLQVVVFFLFIF